MVTIDDLLSCKQPREYDRFEKSKEVFQVVAYIPPNR